MSTSAYCLQVDDVKIDCDLRVDSLDWSPNGQYIAYAIYGKVIIYDLKLQKQVSDFTTGGLTTIKYSICGQVLAVGVYPSNKLFIWNLLDNNICQLEGYYKNTLSIAFSANGFNLTSFTSNNILHIWNWKRAKHVRSLILLSDEGIGKSIDYSTNGKLIASVSHSKTIRISNTQTGKIVRILKGRRIGLVLSVKYSKEGFVISGGFDRRIQLWNANNGELIFQMSSDTTKIEQADIDEMTLWLLLYIEILQIDEIAPGSYVCLVHHKYDLLLLSELIIQSQSL